jgi:hypothetical protein
VWVECMHCFDRNSSGCIGMLPDRLSFYFVLSACSPDCLYGDG